MTLAFSTKFPDGKPTHFIEKIWSGLVAEPTLKFNVGHYEEYVNAHESLFGTDFGYDQILIQPKIQSIREDRGDRWKTGTKIHPVINNRTKDRFQFAPTLVCTGTQKIRILGKEIQIDGRWIDDQSEFKSLIINDGFDSVHDFFQWFDKDFKGKIIHWTPFRYSETTKTKES